MTCACGSTKSYDDCCGRFLSGQAIPATPEELMRSRYTAYTQTDMDYIVRTMKSPAADHFNAEEAADWARATTWLGLEIRNTSQEGDKGFVEFMAQFLLESKKHILHELSEFHLIHGQWFYVDGKSPIKLPFTNDHQIGRNNPCTCGSGKKYKKCCGTA